MVAQNRLSYTVDIVFCIDATGSMAPHIDRVKENALKFHADVITMCKEKGKIIDRLRVRVLAFRDYYVDDVALITSPFYKLPDESDKFRNFVAGIKADGGGDEPENGLEALVESMRSDWQREGDRRRQIIVVFTDAPTHPLEKDGKKSNYPSNMPKSFPELTNLWQGQSPLMHSTFKRLILFAPDDYGWSQIAENWDLTIHHTAKASEGLKDKDYRTILSVIANSV